MWCGTPCQEAGYMRLFVCWFVFFKTNRSPKWKGNCKGKSVRPHCNSEHKTKPVGNQSWHRALKKRLTWLCLIFVVCRHNSHYDRVWAKGTILEQNSLICTILSCRTDICCPFPKSASIDTPIYPDSKSPVLHLLSSAPTDFKQSHLSH